MSDKLGRKKMLIIAVIFYGVFTLPQAFANDLVFFAAFRLIAGFGVGSCIPVVTTVFSGACLPSSAASSLPSAWPSWSSAGFSQASSPTRSATPRLLSSRSVQRDHLHAR